MTTEIIKYKIPVLNFSVIILSLICAYELKPYINAQFIYNNYKKLLFILPFSSVYKNVISNLLQPFTYSTSFLVSVTTKISDSFLLLEGACAF